MLLTWPEWRMEAQDDGMESRARIFEGDRWVCDLVCKSPHSVGEDGSRETIHAVSLGLHRMLRDAGRIVNGVNAYREVMIQNYAESVQ